jgi:hypothetical protein
MGDTADAVALIKYGLERLGQLSRGPAPVAGCLTDYAALASPSSSHSSTLRLAWSARRWQ